MLQKIKIGVMGSAGVVSDQDPDYIEKTCHKLANTIFKNDTLLLTGATTGIPAKVLAAYSALGGLSIGISPAENAKEHEDVFQLPTDKSSIMIYTGLGLEGRNVLNIRSSDIVIIFSGSMGTLNEFTVAYETGKIIGVLKNSGGTADLIEGIVSNLNKKTNSVLIYEEDPEKLILKCLDVYRKNPS
jgi:uncharacterized protein (TIGR00725 family)